MDKLSGLQAEAKEDLIILDNEDLHQQSYKNQIIKPKWLDYKSKYRLHMFQLKADHKRVYRQKWEYYGGKSDAKIYINSDDDIIDIELKIEYYETLVQFIDGVIKSIDNRSWDIKHAQDWKKFVAGGF